MQKIRMKFVVLISVLAFMLQGSLGSLITDKKQVNLQYVGPIDVEMGTKAKLECTFNPIDDKEYIFKWQIWDGNSSQDKYFYETLVHLYSDSEVPFIKPAVALWFKGRLHLSTEPLSSGKSRLTIDSVEKAPGLRYRCEIVDKESKNVIDSTEFHLSLFHTPTIYLDDYNTASITDSDGKSVNMRFIVCIISHVYPLPNRQADVIELVSQTTGNVVTPNREETRKQKIDRNDDLTFTYKVHFLFVPTIKHHNEIFQCSVKLGDDLWNNTVFTSVNSSFPTLVEHPTTFANISISNDIVEEGEQFTISCECDGYPIKKLIMETVDPWNIIASSTDITSQHLRKTMQASRNMSGLFLCTANHHFNKTSLRVKWQDDMVVTKNGDVFTGNKMRIDGGENVVLSCDQKADEPLQMIWHDLDDYDTEHSGDGSHEMVINNATAGDDGSYDCTSYTKSEIQRGFKRFDLIVDIPCIPHLTVEVSQDENELFHINVTCKATQGNPQCEFEMSTNHKFNNEPTVNMTVDSLSWIYEGLTHVDNSPQFSCSLSNYNTKKAEVTARAANSYRGLSTGAYIAIALLVVCLCVALGTVSYKYREKLQAFFNCCSHQKQFRFFENDEERMRLNE